MAKTKGPLFSVGASGTLGKELSFSKFKGTNRSFKRGHPRNPQTDPQQLQRSYMTMGIFAWRDLDQSSKDYWQQQADAKRLRMSGYNYFLSDYINNKITPPPPPGPIEDGLVSWWKFDTGSGSTAYDSWGSNNGSILNPVWVPGKINDCLSFVGTDSSVDVTQTGFSFSNNPRSFEFWTQCESPVNAKGLWISQGTALQYQSFDVAFMNLIKKIRLDCYQYNFEVDFDPTWTTWYHIVVTFDGTDSKIYIDSVLQDTLNMPLINTVSGTRHYIGACSSPGNLEFTGLIDEVRIYNKALDQDEIDHNYGLT